MIRRDQALGFNGGVVSYGTGVLVGVDLGALTFFAWLVGYLVWDGLQWGDLVESVIAATHCLYGHLVRPARRAQQAAGMTPGEDGISLRSQGVSLKLSQYQPRYCMASENFSKLAGLAT